MEAISSRPGSAVWYHAPVDFGEMVLTRQRLIVAVLVAAAFLVRLAVRLAFGEQYICENSYWADAAHTVAVRVGQHS